MAFERLKVQKQIIVEEPETDREMVRRVMKDLVDECDMGKPFSQCPIFTKSDSCDKCKMKMKYSCPPPINKNYEDNTDCALIAMRRLVDFIYSGMRKD